MDSTGESFEAIRAALADRNNILTVKDLCELAGVSRSGYYNWVRSEKNRELRESKDRAAFEQILEAYRFRGYAKGVRGIHMRLLHKESHTRAHTAKHGAFRTGVVSLPSDCFTRFGNPAWPGGRTANFAAFGFWLDVLPKNAESLRNSDVLMRVAVPRRRGPAGLRDPVSALWIMW